MTNSELIDQAQGVARCMTYNDGKTQAQAKHMLHELCHRLGAETIRVHKKNDGLLLVTAYGQSRFMTAGERVLYRLFGVVPPINGWRGDKR
jgi:archaeosine-15-forming tRNA-guanine transglycosylase